MENNNWIDIIGYEGVYKINTSGQVKSISRMLNVCGSKRFCKINKILKPTLSAKGYYTIVLHHGKRFATSIHRLIALHFIPNPESKPYINHINAIKTDNRIENLEWCTHKENMRHAFKLGLINRKSDRLINALVKRNKDRIGTKHYMSKVVLNTVTGIYYESASEAAKSIPMPASTLYGYFNHKHPNQTNFIYV